MVIPLCLFLNRRREKDSYAARADHWRLPGVLVRLSYFYHHGRRRSICHCGNRKFMLPLHGTIIISLERESLSFRVEKAPHNRCHLSRGDRTPSQNNLESSKY